MNAKKIVQSLVLGMSICAFSTSVALADTGGAASPAHPGYDFEAVVQPAVIPPVIIEEQRRIDVYLFEENRKEIESMGFTVTHTAPMQDYVEIGITPFKQEYADYLYRLFGKDKIKVVEGQQAVPLVQEPIPPEEQAAAGQIDPDTPVSATAVDTPAVAADLAAPAGGGQNSDAAEKMVTVTAQEDAKSPASGISPVVYGAGAIIVLGGIGLAVRKLKMSQN